MKVHTFVKDTIAMAKNEADAIAAKNAANEKNIKESSAERTDNSGVEEKKTEEKRSKKAKKSV